MVIHISTLLLILVLLLFSGFLILFLILPVFILYNLLKKKHHLYSYLLLVYPVLIFFSGQHLREKGRTLNAADLESLRSATGEIKHFLSIGSGDHYFYFGTILLIAAFPIIFTCLFFVIHRILIKIRWI